MSRALKEARTNAKLNQADAGKKIGVHFVTIYAWENERRTDQPSDPSLERAARVYRTTADALKRRAKAIEKTLGAAPSAPSEEAAAAPSQGSEAPQAVTRGRARRGRPRKKAVAAARGGSESVVAVSSIAAAPNDAHFPKILRALADLAEHVTLTPEVLSAAQRAMSSPALLDVFAAFKSRPLSDSEVDAAIDATSMAVRSFLGADRTGSRRGLRRVS